MALIGALLIKTSRVTDISSVVATSRRTRLGTLGIQRIEWAQTPAAENGQPASHFLLVFDESAPLSAAGRLSLQGEWREQAGAQDIITRLELILDLPGHSASEIAGAHYAVETDPAPGWSDEIGRWYAEEHLPGLAGVPGCVRARRFLNLDTSPHSFACYDLTSIATLETGAWLKVRQTPWSDKCRPHFTNTLRTRFNACGVLNAPFLPTR